ncbi:uncharacterized protein [Ptychodera flava]|uniref:uncharacterized protein n=1 Tax=Ptychodera flava TaxID=63121 RepID=UPI003969E9B3
MQHDMRSFISTVNLHTCTKAALPNSIDRTSLHSLLNDIFERRLNFKKRHAKTQEYYHNHSRTSDLAIIICYNTDTGSETDQKRVAIEELEDSNRNIKSLCRYVHNMT